MESSSGLPILIELDDSEEYINRLLPFHDEVLNSGGMVTIDDIEIIGVFLTLTTERIIVSPYWRLVVAGGFLGGLTTFLHSICA